MDAIHFAAMLLILAVRLRTVDTVTCHEIYYRASRIQSESLGFCWYFFNGDFRLSQAEQMCRDHNGRLPAVNSYTKAAKMAQFTLAMRELYHNGSFDQSWLPVYASGWQGLTLWGDRVTENEYQQIWNTSQAVVSYQGFDEDSEVPQDGGACTVFNMSSGLWQFSACDGVHTVLCEEVGHQYENEGPDRAATTTPDPDTLETHEDADHNAGGGGELHNYVAESCPAHFQLSRGRCLAIGHVSGIFAANQFCELRNSFLAVVTNANDERVLGEFIKESKLKKWKAFLSPVKYTADGKFIWTSTGQSAEYVAAKLGLIPNQALLKDTLLAVSTNGLITTCHRHKCNARAFCQANGEEYYAYDEKATSYDDF